MLLHDLVTTSQAVASTRSRKQKIAHLARLLAACPPDEVAIAVSFLSGDMRQGRIGLGYAAARDAAPLHAADAPSLTLLQVDEALSDMKALSGKGSQKARLEAFSSLLSRATEGGQRFLKDLVIGNVRHGALEGIMAEAVAEATRIDPAKVRRAAMLGGNLAEVATAALVEGEAGLARFHLLLGRPVQPMLAQTAEGVEDALTRLDDAALEYKLDGARVQVHRRGDDVWVFTRQLHDVTDRVPEVVAAVKALPAEQVILDGEVIALRENGRPHPFQTTMRRFGRRGGEHALMESLPLSVFFFDCLHWDGDDVLDQPSRDRLALMAARMEPSLVIPRVVPASQEEAEAFLDASLAAGHEGVMAKALNAPYEAGRRGAEWLKIKPAHTLDLVVIGVEWGSGRRQGWLSNLHLACRDEESGQFVMLGKTFKGMTDALLAWQTEELKKREIATDGWAVKVRPELVVEIAFDGVQESPHYPAGLALRFARVKGYRLDKTPEQADTLATVRGIFEASRK